MSRAEHGFIKWLTALLEQVAENRVTYRRLLTADGDPTLTRTVCDRLATRARQAISAAVARGHDAGMDHNALAMNRGVLQAAQRFVHGDHLEEGMLNRVEAVIRTFDPCLSCSTHALGTMPLHVRLVRSDGTVADEAWRG